MKYRITIACFIYNTKISHTIIQEMDVDLYHITLFIVNPYKYKPMLLDRFDEVIYSKIFRKTGAGKKFLQSVIEPLQRRFNNGK